MAAFTSSHLTALAIGHLIANSPTDYWQAIVENTTDSEVLAFIGAIDYASSDTININKTLHAIRDAIQELQAVESLVRVTQTAYTPRGEIETTAEFEHLVP
jgi:hypothetical protein